MAMKFLIEYMGGAPDRYWHGTITIEANDAAQAIRKIENDIACIPASIYAVNPAKEESAQATGQRWLMEELA